MAKPAEIEAYLQRIRKTIAESRAAVEGAALRIAETDRLLAREGLTRDQVRNFRVRPDHLLAVNEELRRRGLPPLDDREEASDFDAATAAVRRDELAQTADGAGEELSERQRRFGNLMHEFRL